MVKKFLSSSAFAGPAPHFDVTAWGATGDGSTDDTDAVLATFAAADQSRGRVFFPPGTYRVRLGELVDLNGLEISGAGAATVLRPTDGASGTLLRLSNDNFVHDLTINGDSNDTSVDFAVHVRDGQRNRIERVRISNLTGTAIFFSGACSDLDIVDCRCEDYAQSGINGGTGASLERFRFVGNHCTTSVGNPNFSNGIGLTGGSRGEISGNYVDGLGSTLDTAHHLNGITLGGCSNVTIANNRSRRHRDDGITLYNACEGISIVGNVLTDSVQTAGVYIGPSGTHRRITIADNICTNNGSAATNGFGVNIDGDLQDSVIEGNVCSGNVIGIVNTGSSAARSSSGVSIVGNQCAGNLRSGVALHGGTRYRIVGNSCRRNGQNTNGQDGSGILLNGVHENLVEGNYCEDDQATGTQTYGIRLNGSHRNTVTGNYANGNLLTGIFLTDSEHNLVSGNYTSANSQVSASQHHGIHLFSTANGRSRFNDVLGNLVRRGTGAKQQRWGILVQGDTNVISGNDVLEAGTSGGISDGGTANVVRENRGHNPQGPAAISVGASPFTYTAGNTPEAVYVRGGTVSSIRRNGTTIFDNSPATVWLEPGESVTVTYSKVPTMTKDRK